MTTMPQTTQKSIPGINSLKNIRTAVIPVPPVHSQQPVLLQRQPPELPDHTVPEQPSLAPGADHLRLSNR